jgi:hypothetical protein
MTLTTCQNLKSDFRFSTTLIIVGFGKKIQNHNTPGFNSEKMVLLLATVVAADFIWRKFIKTSNGKQKFYTYNDKY